MTCLHQKAATPIGRFAMLLSTNGVGCVQCRSRVYVPGRVRLGLLGMFLSYMALAPFSIGAAMGPILAFVLIGLPWLYTTKLNVVRTSEKDA
ncbi:MAG: hypothetical protein ACI8Y8_004122 [Planctomycetota bacterium]|jgi:hypothetical protein